LGAFRQGPRLVEHIVVDGKRCSHAGIIASHRAMSMHHVVAVEDKGKDSPVNGTSASIARLTSGA
jgi:hypothetical protein